MGIKTAREIFSKTPDETRRIAFDFSGDDLTDGEVISLVNGTSGSPSGDPDDLAVSTGAIVDNLSVVVTLTKGRVGVAYRVHAKVTTSFGQVLESCGRIRIGDC